MIYQSVIRDPGGNSLVRVVSSVSVVDGSVLIVPADSEAFFVVNGIVSEPYPSGRHTVFTGMSPFFVRLRNMMTNGDMPLTCQVFFVNKFKENTEQGGTGSILFQEKRFKISMKAKSAYVLRYSIFNPKAFISKLVGFHNYEFDNEDIRPAMVGMIIPILKEAISAALSSTSVHEIQGQLTDVSNQVFRRLAETLEEYGIALKAISITAINITEEDISRLNALEEKYAAGRLITDIEVDNIERVYGNVNNRTMAEMLTGSVRGPEGTVARVNHNAGMVGAMASMPWQFAMADMAMQHMNGNFSEVVRGFSTTTRSQTSQTNTSGHGRNVPPPLPN